MKILITGGCGYVGSVLTEALLEDKHQIIVVDNQWFGNYLKPNSNLVNIKADIRDVDLIPMENVDVVVHLANIANDPAVDLNPTLSWEVNVLAAQQLIEKAINNGVSQFIYASSGSVYGVKDEADVTEDLSLVPISVYNKTKMVAERVLLSYKDRINVHCIRPATVCGLSSRMRLDVSVNMLTFQALKNKKITVFGGEQTRPNIHIKDMIRVYDHFINNSLIESGCYNAGFENISILEIAKLVQNKIETEITISISNDPRSYRQNSDKLLSTGFERKYNVETAIDEIIEAYRNGKLIETEESYTVKWMKENILK
jgi:nucleoside-diphosphate-sugar epimerase